mgnify:CR=1 FL=1|jgi:hypothetical protein
MNKNYIYLKILKANFIFNLLIKIILITVQFFYYENTMINKKSKEVYMRLVHAYYE